MSDLVEALDHLPARAGPIGLLSSDEFTRAAEDFDRALIAPGARVGLLTCAGHENEAATLAQARAHLRRLDATALILAHEPGAPANDALLSEHDVVYIPGGDPRALLRCMRGSPIWVRILEGWRNGVPLIGSSAGAMALSHSCLVAREGESMPTEWSEGLGPLRRVAIAVHATTRPEAWLRRVAEDSPLPVLALDDETGVVLGHSRKPRTFGPGMPRLVG